MPTIKYAILTLLQLISYCLYAQKSSEISLGNDGEYHYELLSDERYDNISKRVAELAHDTKKPKSIKHSTSVPTSTSYKPNAEEKYTGFKGSIGYGLGYSSHASSYFVDDGFRVKEYSGFRTIVLDTKIGWNFHKRIGISGTWKYSPGNTTISPYRSNYLGGELAYFFGDFQQFSIHGGLGKYQAKVGRDELFGNGLLANYGAVIKAGNNFGIELNVLSGKIEFDDANLDSTEFNFTAGLVFLF